MDNPKTQISEQLKKATNILVTVSTNPSVDQLAGAVGLTLLLNKLGKHATAVFSGEVPSTLEFLQPDKTLEKNTDSLRDFIIALDKSKADKLRYKVEDQMVKIFITPYRTSLSDKDLEFSQGDFNVDVVIALGVTQQQDLDEAITTHGRILHDATVIAVNIQSAASLGSINWVNSEASSLCESLVDLGLELKSDVLDGQMATAFLTGIVAETNRFSNEKTSSLTMELSAKLMAAGANQQLIASQLQPAPAEPPADNSSEPQEDVKLPEVDHSDTDLAAEPPADLPAKPSTLEPVEEPPKTDGGTLRIDHGETKALADSESNEPEQADEPIEQIDIDAEGKLESAKRRGDIKQKVIEPLSPEEKPVSEGEPQPEAPRLVTEPPVLGGKLTANSVPEALDPTSDPLSTPPLGGPGQLLSHMPPVTEDLSVAIPPFGTPSSVPTPAVQDIIGSTSSTSDDTSNVAISEPPQAPVTDVPASPVSALPLSPSNLVDESPIMPITPEPLIKNSDPETLTSSSAPANDVTAARDAVQQAVSGTTSQILEPIQSLNATPMDLNLGDMPAVATSPASAFADTNLMPPTPPAPTTDFPPAQDPVPSVSPAHGLNLSDPGMPADDTAASVDNPIAPPPVPPPMMPPAEPGMTHGQQLLPNAEDENAPPANPQIF